MIPSLGTKFTILCARVRFCAWRCVRAETLAFRAPPDFYLIYIILLALMAPAIAAVAPAAGPMRKCLYRRFELVLTALKKPSMVVTSCPKVG
jgi:hypothetical protein